jgi:hypothetical protein
MRTAEILEQRKLNDEQKSQGRQRWARDLRMLAPAECHGLKCPYACWFNGETYCRSRELPDGRHVSVTTLSACPEHCWGLDTKGYGHLEEAIDEATRVLRESSIKAVEIQGEIGRLLG